MHGLGVGRRRKPLSLRVSEDGTALGLEAGTCVAIVTRNLSAGVVTAASLLTGFLGTSSHYAGDVPRGHLALLLGQVGT